MRLFRQLSAIIELTRPLNVLVTGLVVFVGAFIAKVNWLASGRILSLAIAVAMLVAAGGNAVNDAFDAKIDSINRPKRPIPAARISRAGAFVFGAILLLTGTAIGWLLSPALGTIAFLVAFLLVIYSASLKLKPLWGNLAVAICAGLAFIFGAISVGGNPLTALIPASFAVLIHLAREIVKDIEDIPGDTAAGAKTLPILIGIRTARRIAAAVILLLILLTPLPWLLNIFGTPYITLVMLTVNLPLAIIMYYLWSCSTVFTLHRISQSLKFIMLTGLISLYVG